MPAVSVERMPPCVQLSQGIGTFTARRAVDMAACCGVLTLARRWIRVPCDLLLLIVQTEGLGLWGWLSL
jgi:hypothetical protein